MSNHNQDLERLRAELAQENQMKEMLQQSLQELMVTVGELDKRMDGIDEEGNEWKTRYETQCEMNKQLQHQIIDTRDKIEKYTRNWQTAKMSKAGFSYQDTKDKDSDVTPHMLKQKEKEKDVLVKQLRDLEWRMDQESKAYHKANEERKQYQLEINTAKDSINDMKNKQKQDLLSHSQGNTPRGHANIPPDQRILDPRRGPIRKTAAVQRLPKLE